MNEYENYDPENDPYSWKSTQPDGDHSDYDDFPVHPVSVFGGGSQYPEPKDGFEKFFCKYGCLIIFIFFLGLAIAIKFISGV